MTSRANQPCIHVSGYAHVETDLSVPVGDLSTVDIQIVIDEAARRGMIPSLERGYVELAYEELQRHKPASAAALLNRALNEAP